jgi:lantibiotic modifying enzyme
LIGHGYCTRVGAAHGLCGILQILLSFPTFMAENPEAEQLIKNSIDFYITLQDNLGNFPCALDEVGPGRQREENDLLVHWCHGAPGAIYMLAKAYLHYKDKNYLDACLKCGEAVWTRGLLRKGPGNFSN